MFPPAGSETRGEAGLTPLTLRFIFAQYVPSDYMTFSHFNLPVESASILSTALANLFSRRRHQAGVFPPVGLRLFFYLLLCEVRSGFPEAGTSFPITPCFVAKAFPGPALFLLIDP